jgi:hypothetical protein
MSRVKLRVPAVYGLTGGAVGVYQFLFRSVIRCIFNALKPFGYHAYHLFAYQ